MRIFAPVVLFEQLLVDLGVVADWLLDHRWERLQVWSSVVLVVKDGLISHASTHQETTQKASSDSVSSEEAVGGSGSVDVRPVFDPSLIWVDWNSALESHHSSADEESKGIGNTSTDDEPGNEIGSVLVLKSLEVLEWVTFGSVHVLLCSEVEPWVAEDVVFKPAKSVIKMKSGTYHCMYSISVSLSGWSGIAISKM